MFVRVELILIPIKFKDLFMLQKYSRGYPRIEIFIFVSDKTRNE